MSRSTKKNPKSNSKSLIRSPQNTNSALTPKTTKPSISNQHLPFTKSHKPSCDFSTLSIHHTNELLSHATYSSNSKNILAGYTHTSKSPISSQPKKNKQVLANEVSNKKVSTKLSFHAAPKRKSGQFVIQSQQVISEKASAPTRSMPPQVEVLHQIQDKTPPKKKIQKTIENEDENQEFVCIYSTLDIHDLMNQSKQDEMMTQDTEGPTNSSLQCKRLRPSQRSQGIPGHIHIESSLESTTQTSSEGIATQESERSHMKRSILEIQDSGNYSKKKTRHIQIDLEAKANERVLNPKTSDFRDEISDYLPTQEFKTENSRLMTEESELGRAIDEAKPELSRNFYNFQDKTMRRDEEINDFRYNITETLDRISIWEEQCLQSRDRLQRNFNMITQRIQTFTSRMISIFQAQTESMITDIGLEYERETMKLGGFSEGLKGISKWLQDTDMDIKDNYNKILHNIGDEPYRMIMEKYLEKLTNFEQFFSNMKDISKEPTHLLPTEKLSHFKRKLKITMNEAFSENIADQDRFQIDLINKMQVSSPSIPKVKTLGELEEFLRSDEKELPLKVKPWFSNDVVISFKDKDRFVDAVQVAAEENYTHGSHLDTLITNVILTESEELNPHLLMKNLDTPKLNSKIEGGFPEYNNSMTEDIQDSNMSVQGNSEELSLNKYMSLLDKVNQKQLNRNNYLKSGGIYDYGKRAASFYDNTNFINFLENKMKDEGVRETCQKSLFQSPAFKENMQDEFVI